MRQLFIELKRYVGFTNDDGVRLSAMKPRLSSRFVPTVDAFYDRILDHTDARAALERGERRVGQLRLTLLQWLDELFTGPWDDAYLARRARIGTVHVQIGLPQHYMVTAMNVLRTNLLEGLVDATADERLSLNRVLDLDLAIMLHTYRLDLEARQAKAERLATFGQLVGSIGHELRNPLGVIETSLYVLRSKGDSDPKTTKHLDRIGHQVSVANAIITQLLELIRDRPLARQRVDVSALVADVANAVPRPEGVALELPGGPLPAISGDPTQLRQVLVNLLENAVHAASPSGRARISVTTHADEVQLIVDDTGTGIDPSIASRLFEPLVTTKPRGIGLGLALVKRIAERHGGSVEVSRGPLGGARFLVRVPEAT